MEKAQQAKRAQQEAEQAEASQRRSRKHAEQGSATMSASSAASRSGCLRRLPRRMPDTVIHHGPPAQWHPGIQKVPSPVLLSDLLAWLPPV